MVYRPARPGLVRVVAALQPGLNFASDRQPLPWLRRPQPFRRQLWQWTGAFLLFDVVWPSAVLAWVAVQVLAVAVWVQFGLG